jgi:phospholipid/cholesterol/gamma-HCH transport system substrate-binding protein
MTAQRARMGLALVLAAVLAAGVVVIVRADDARNRNTVVGFFANSNGLFVGDQVRILGVPVGEVERIEPLPGKAKITFWFDRQYLVPASAKAVILSPTLISARAIQLTPAYTSGPTLNDGAVLADNRTAVPVEWDDLRQQLQKLTQTLQPTQPGGVAPLGSFINTAADNLRGNGATIRDTVTKLAQATAALGDHSTDLFSTVRNLALVVSALQGSSDLMRDLNENLASVTGLLNDSPDKVGRAVTSLSQASSDLSALLSDNSEPLGVAVDKLSSITSSINESSYDLKQVLHVAPTLLANYVNIYQPAQAAFTGILAFNNFADPITFICGAIQAASRLGAKESAKLCVQYLAPIVKNRQYNYPPFGLNPIVGTDARPNEITYSEDRLRPDYQPPAPPAPDPAALAPARQTDPAAGLPGLMVLPAGGS